MDDPDKTARARMVYWMAGAIALVTVVSQLALMALHPASSGRFVLIIVVVLAVCAGDLVLVQRGLVTAAAWFQTLAIWALMTASAWTSGGLSGQSITAQLVVVALGGMLVGWRGGLGFAGLTLATVCGLGLAETAGMLPESSITQTAATRAVTLSAYLVVLAVVQLLVMRDLQGARDRARAELRERVAAERFANTLIDSAPGIFYTLDSEGKRLRWNRRVEEITGLTAGELADLGLLGTVVEEDRRLVAGKVAETLEKGSAEVVARMKTSDGDRDYLLTGHRVMIDEAPCVVGFGVDITERRRAEEEVRALKDELEKRVQERTKQLEDTLGSLESFSYSVSHDLRAPLRAINGFATILEADYAADLGDAGGSMCARIRDNTLRMGILIDDLLAFSRLGYREVRTDSVDMGAVVASVISDLAGEAHGSVAEFQVAALPVVQGDSALLRQAWVNLLANAVKFSAGRPRPRIQVAYTCSEGEDVFCVSDNGVGFDASYSAKLFQVFERLHGREFEGTGVGLAIVKRIVEAHGGRAWGDARQGEGARFFFTLPRDAAETPSEAAVLD